MKSNSLSLFLVFLGFLLGPVSALGDAQHKHGGEHMAASCHARVTITEEAERQPGGALYKGAAPMHHGKKKPEYRAKPMTHAKDMKGAHLDHAARHGGAFFMAPNKINHLEAVYSPECGFQLFLYNAFTKPIQVGGYQAFIKAIPDSEDEAEVIRFLAPNKVRATLEAHIGDSVSRPFKIELYLKFPSAADPELFTVHIPKPK